MRLRAKADRYDVALGLALVFSVACTGPVGPAGAPGAPGTPGVSPDAGTIPAIAVTYANMTPTDLQESKMAMELTAVSIPADGQPVVNMTITERHGFGVKGIPVVDPLAWRFALMKLTPGVNGTINDSWVSYMAANDHSSASTESATAASLTDNGDGTYKYRFAKNVTAGVNVAGTSYEPAKIHRLVVLLSEGSNAFTPINLVKEFVPSTGADVTGQNDKVDQGACLECHTTFRAISGGTADLGDGQFHGGSRFDVRTCVACHNDQRKYKFITNNENPPDFPTIAADKTWTGDLQVVNFETVMNFPVFVHKIHMGQNINLTGGTYGGYEKPYDVTFPQDVRNCVKCHQSPAPMADNYKNAPSRRACGACHDDVSFVSPAPPGRRGHSGGPQSSDGNCLLCHSENASAGVAKSHPAVSPPNPNNIYNDPVNGTANTNAAWVAAAGTVPSGASVITYEVKSASTWTDNSGTTPLTRPQIVFRILLDGVPVIFPVSTGTNELIPNFVGGPSAYFAFAVPQDNITAPADFNASGSAYIRNIWNNTGRCAGTPITATDTPTGSGILSAPDAAGFYTLKLTCVVIPASGATMLTGGIGYTYALGKVNKNTPPDPALNFIDHNQPFTQTNLSKYGYTPNEPANPGRRGGKGGLVVPAPDVSIAATGFTARRPIVSTAKCQSCHESLGVGPDFHAGQRNDSATCNFCHNPNQNSSGWSGNEKDMVHSIHGAEKRGVHFTWHQVSSAEGYWLTTYPAILNICTTCHLNGTFDFSTDAANAALPNMLVSTTTTGDVASPPPAGFSPYAPAGSYGGGFKFDALSGTSTPADPRNLVTTPIMSACSACHDSKPAIDHMQTNGGQFWVPRGPVPTNPQGEQCLVCHGPNRIASIATVHIVKTP